MKVTVFFTHGSPPLLRYPKAETIIPPQTEGFPYWTIKHYRGSELKATFHHVGTVKTLEITGGEEEDNGTVRSN